MAQIQHTDIWRERRNQELGLPLGTRHSDQWYMAEMQRRRAAEAQAEQHAKEQQAKESQYQTSQQQSAANYAANAAAGQAAQQAAAQQAAAQQAAAAAAAEVDRQAKMRARRNEWDRLNNQGAYDPDGWQSIGYQPDPVAMPSWWLDGLELGTTAPAVPLPVPPVVPSPAPVTPPAAPPAPPALGTSLPVAGNAGLPPQNAPAPGTSLPVAGNAGPPPINALRTAAQSRQSNWGVPAQNPFSGQQPDPGAWGQQPAAAKSATQSWAQPAGTYNVGFWGQKPQQLGAQLWGHKQPQAETWGKM